MAARQCRFCNHRMQGVVVAAGLAACGPCRAKLGRWLATSPAAAIEALWDLDAGEPLTPLELRLRLLKEVRPAPEMEGSLATFRAALRNRAPDSETFAELAQAYAEMGLYGDALRCAGDALVLAEKEHDVVRALAIIFEPRHFAPARLPELVGTLFPL